MQRLSTTKIVAQLVAVLFKEFMAQTKWGRIVLEKRIKYKDLYEQLLERIEND